RLVLSRKSTPLAERVEAILVSVLVHHGSERVDLLQALGRRHLDAEIGPQPAPVVEAVFGDGANVGPEQGGQPADNLFTMEVCAVGVADRNVGRADRTTFAPRGAEAANIAAAPRPSRPVIDAQSFVVGLGVEAKNADIAEVGKFFWRLPLVHSLPLSE